MPDINLCLVIILPKSPFNYNDKHSVQNMYLNVVPVVLYNCTKIAVVNITKTRKNNINPARRFVI